MMISPEQYIDEHRNDTIEELIAARRELENDIAELEKKLFGIGEEEVDWTGLSDEEKERLVAEWDKLNMIVRNPGPEVEYQCNLMYLAALCDFLREKYNREVIWGHSDEFDDDMEE